MVYSIQNSFFSQFDYVTLLFITFDFLQRQNKINATMQVKRQKILNFSKNQINLCIYGLFNETIKKHNLRDLESLRILKSEIRMSKTVMNSLFS